MMYNSHVHTEFSNDCAVPAAEMCGAAIQKGVSGIAITDHCNVTKCISRNSYQTAIHSAKKALELQKQYECALDVAVGIEINEMIYKPDYAQRIIDAADFDVVLASVHSVVLNCIPICLSEIDFGNLSKSETEDIFTHYYKDLLQTVKSCDFDVCAHLTLPLRYANGVYRKNIDIRNYYSYIEKILSVIIDRKKALELNTSELNRQLFDFMPNEEILRMYHDLGGTLITIGSDAHKPENIDFGFKEASEVLNRTGFNSYVFYKERSPMSINF